MKPKKAYYPVVNHFERPLDAQVANASVPLTFNLFSGPLREGKQIVEA